MHARIRKTYTNEQKTYTSKPEHTQAQAFVSTDLMYIQAQPHTSARTFLRVLVNAASSGCMSSVITSMFGFQNLECAFVSSISRRYFRTCVGSGKKSTGHRVNGRGLAGISVTVAWVCGGEAVDNLETRVLETRTGEAKCTAAWLTQ